MNRALLAVVLFAVLFTLSSGMLSNDVPYDEELARKLLVRVVFCHADSHRSTAQSATA